MEKWKRLYNQHTTNSPSYSYRFTNLGIIVIATGCKQSKIKKVASAKKKETMGLPETGFLNSGSFFLASRFGHRDV